MKHFDLQIILVSFGLVEVVLVEIEVFLSSFAPLYLPLAHRNSRSYHYQSLNSKNQALGFPPQEYIQELDGSRISSPSKTACKHHPTTIVPFQLHHSSKLHLKCTNVPWTRRRGGRFGANNLKPRKKLFVCLWVFWFEICTTFYAWCLRMVRMNPSMPSGKEWLRLVQRMFHGKWTGLDCVLL